MTADRPGVAFDLCGDLPTGVAMLEASAGTGKTYTIAALVTRFVAEGHCRLDQILLMTYTRAATQELRERVRRRLRDTAAVLHLAASGHPDRAADPVTVLLAAAEPAEVRRRAERLDDAVMAFDAATIVTTHSFCEDVRHSLGIVADVDPAESFVADVGAIVAEVADDLYLQAYGTAGAPPAPFPPELAATIARAAVLDPQASLAAGPTIDEDPAARQAFAERARTGVTARLRSLRLVTYDDLITRVAAAVVDPAVGPVVGETLRRRFRIVMVDEFQDTDAAQWQIVRAVFAGRRTLVLIGDPKQAIYGFRGGDIVTYLTARRAATTIATLTDNHRSDADLVAGVTRFFAGVALGDPAIRVEPVRSVHPQPRLFAAGPPLRLRTIAPVGRMPQRRAAIERDVVRDISTLLRGPARLALPTTVAAPDSREVRPVRPGDIAVIVWRNADADAIAEQLREAGINAVVTGTQDVSQTPARDSWLALLRALERPSRPQLVRAAMCSAFFGWTGTDLAADQGGAAVDATAALLQDWSAAFAAGGIAAVQRRAEASLTARLLQRADGERELTDLRHLGELLHARGAGLAGSIEWLSGGQQSGDEITEASRRLDSDSDAVQVLTVHSSKGLQFPIVYLPYAWNRHVGSRRGETLRLHDETGRRIVDVRGPHTPEKALHRRLAEAEEAGEVLRQFYVAMTRAACQVTLWWTFASQNTPASPLQRIAGARLAGSVEPAEAYPIRDIADIARALDVVAEPVDESGPQRVGRVSGAAPPPRLALAPFDRDVDTTWQRTSYTRLTAAGHDARLRGEAAADPDSPGQSDEPGRTAPSAQPAADPAHEPAGESPWATLPVGADFGVVVHHVYEHLDTRAPELAAETELRCHEALRDHAIPGLTATELARAIVPTLTTPLGPDAVTLADVSPRDRLAELEFEMPLAGGDHPGHPAPTLDSVADLLQRTLADDDPLAGYPGRMRGAGLQAPLAGFLTGSIDAVVRMPADDRGATRFVVVDYKTNWLGDGMGSGHLPLSRYHDAALTEAMIDAHYPLQGLLYLVALHRFLRWRLPGYDPDQHLGGLRYLFVRGMTPTAPPPAGVFAWSPPPGLVPALSDLLAGVP